MKPFGKGDDATLRAGCSRNRGEDPLGHKRQRDGIGREEALRWNR